jgi:hypothetical protein
MFDQGPEQEGSHETGSPLVALGGCSWRCNAALCTVNHICEHSITAPMQYTSLVGIGWSCATYEMSVDRE